MDNYKTVQISSNKGFDYDSTLNPSNMEAFSVYGKELNESRKAVNVQHPIESITPVVDSGGAEPKVIKIELGNKNGFYNMIDYISIVYDSEIGFLLDKDLKPINTTKINLVV